MIDDSNRNLVAETSKKNLSVSMEKSLTFKDWKTLKNSEPKSTLVNKQTKVKYVNRTNSKGQASLGFLYRYNSTPNSFNGVNNFIVPGNVFETGRNCYDATCYAGFINYNRKKHINNNYNRTQHNFYGSTNVKSIPDDFFATDGTYCQRNLIQKPLSLYTLRKDEISKNVSQKLERAENKCNEKKEKISAAKQNDLKKTIPLANNITCTQNAIIYVPNPNASKDGKAFIPKPKLPGENLQISKEEKKQQWKEYREAMKPFKNREFYNAKRVVQRLGKKNPSELNEKELFRLANAREVMAAHKARLTAKYSSYVKAEEKSNELGEVYVLKKPTLKDFENAKGKPEDNQNYAESQRSFDADSGRKILGCYSSFKEFIPGSILESTNHGIQQQLTV